MKINEKTWPSIEARLNQIYEKEEIKFTQSEIYGQKPANGEKSNKKSTNSKRQRCYNLRRLV